VSYSNDAAKCEGTRLVTTFLIADAKTIQAPLAQRENAVPGQHEFSQQVYVQRGDKKSFFEDF
jgi:hypothetical protein